MVISCGCVGIKATWWPSLGKLEVPVLMLVLVLVVVVGRVWVGLGHGPWLSQDGSFRALHTRP